MPRQIQRAGLRRGQIAFSDAALRVLITQYTREAGVRGLDRAVRAVCRKVARQVAEGTVTGRVSISGPRVRELLGNQRRERQQRRRRLTPGVASGLAWTPVGGDVLYVEVAATPGSGRLTLTGQLGDVMRESAQAAFTWLRGHVGEVAPDAPADWFKTHDVHVHVHAGAIPKDGPSAGITIATALTSLVSGRAVRDDVAMTGEITLTGDVLPIGGLKEKALGAQDLGYKLVIAPERNAADLEDFPESLREGMEFHFVSRIGDVLDSRSARRGRATRSALSVRVVAAGSAVARAVRPPRWVRHASHAPLKSGPHQRSGDQLALRGTRRRSGSPRSPVPLPRRLALVCAFALLPASTAATAHAAQVVKLDLASPANAEPGGVAAQSNRLRRFMPYVVTISGTGSLWSPGPDAPSIAARPSPA